MELRSVGDAILFSPAISIRVEYRGRSAEVLTFSDENFIGSFGWYQIPDSLTPCEWSVFQVGVGVTAEFYLAELVGYTYGRSRGFDSAQCP